MRSMLEGIVAGISFWADREMWTAVGLITGVLAVPVVVLGTAQWIFG